MKGQRQGFVDGNVVFHFHVLTGEHLPLQSCSAGQDVKQGRLQTGWQAQHCK